jgi:hypothetical protein
MTLNVMRVSLVVLGVVSVGLGGCGGSVGGGGTGGRSASGHGGAGGATSTGGTTGAGGAGGASGGGGSGGSGTCGTVEPCGGNLTGTWTFTAECINSVALQPEAQQICATASIGSVTANATGTVSFNSDLTYSFSENSTGLISWSIPSSCTGGMTCAAYGAYVQAGINTGTFICTGTTTCSCTQTAVANVVDSGTYSLSGNNIVLTSASGGTTMTGAYCVQGGTLHLVTVDTTMNMGPMGQATIDKDVTAQKQ